MTTKNLTSKRNVLIALTMLGFFVVVGVISLFSVFAWSSTNLESLINVDYVTDNISGDVSAKYWISGNSKIEFSGGVNGELHILADENQNESKNLYYPNNLVLTKTNNRIIFEFIFENTSDEVAFTIDLTSSPIENANSNNIIEKYYVSNSELAINNFPAVESVSWQNSFSTQTVSAGSGTKKYIYIEAYIDEIVLDANYEGGFVWNLNNVEV